MKSLTKVVLLLISKHTSQHNAKESCRVQRKLVLAQDANFTFVCKMPTRQMKKHKKRKQTFVKNYYKDKLKLKLKSKLSKFVWLLKSKHVLMKQQIVLKFLLLVPKLL